MTGQERKVSCVSCGLRHLVSDGASDTETVIVITSDQSLNNDHHDTTTDVELSIHKNNIPIFLISFQSENIKQSYAALTKFGSFFAVKEHSAISAPELLQGALMSVLHTVDNIDTRSLVSTGHTGGGHQLSGHFSVSYESEASLRVTLSVPDEEKVEFFEVESPDGETKILSKFEDGMVYFIFSGLIQTGLWKYRARIYTDTIIDDDDLVSVDAVLSTHDAPIDVTSEVFISDTEPKRVFCRLQAGDAAVLHANVTAVIMFPDNTQALIQLYDNGLGYPDITSRDGVYSGYIPRLASVPGYYSVAVNVESTEETVAASGF